MISVFAFIHDQRIQSCDIFLTLGFCSILFTMTLFITTKFFTTSFVFAQMYQFSLKLNSLQQEFSLTSNYMGTNTVVVKRVGCNLKMFECNLGL